MNKEKKEIQNWWADNPMTYGEIHGEAKYLAKKGHQSFDLGTQEFFDKADERFLSWNVSLHPNGVPFSKIFPYKKYAGRDVLEIGCGMGFMAMNWALQGANIVASDLNSVAVEQTRQRFRLRELRGDILQADAENLPLKANSFGFIYSWGVLHHTPGIQKAINRAFELLEPGGEIGLMLYNRGSFREKYITEYIEGYLHLEDEFLDPLALNSRYADGARKEGNPHTWPVTEAEVRTQLLAKFENVQIKLLGVEVKSILDLILPGLGSFLMPVAMKKALARRWGWSLWITGKKPS